MRDHVTIRHSILFRAISHLVNILGIFKNEGPSPPSERTSSRRECFSGSWDHANPDSLPVEACVKEVTCRVLAGGWPERPHMAPSHTEISCTANVPECSLRALPGTGFMHLFSGDYHTQFSIDANYYSHFTDEQSEEEKGGPQGHRATGSTSGNTRFQTPKANVQSSHLYLGDYSPSQAERDFKGHLTGLQPSKATD